MANTAGNVLVGKPLVTGGILRAVLGTAVPTDATTAPAGAFAGAGYVSDAGVVQTIGTDSTSIKAWGGDEVRKVQTSHTVTYQFTLIETNDESLGIYYGDGSVTSGAGARAVEITSAELEHAAYVIEMKDGDNKIRITIGDGQVTERGDVSYVDSNAIAYQVTVTCYPDADGVKATIYTDDGS